MYKVIIVNLQSEDTIQIFEKNELPKLLSIKEILSSKYTLRKNTIVLHNIDFEKEQFGGLNRLMDNSDFRPGNDYEKTIFLPIFNLFNGMTGTELIAISNFIYKKQNNYDDCIYSLEELFSKLKPDIFRYLVHQKKFKGYLSYGEIPKKYVEIRTELKNQIDKRQRFVRKNTNNNIKFIVNFNTLEKYLENEGFLDIDSITTSKMIPFEINEKDKNDEYKYFATLTKFYEGFIETNNCSLLNEYMNFLEYPNIYERNNENVYLPFSIIRYCLLYPENIKINKIHLGRRIHAFKNFLKIETNNKLTEQLASIFNFKLNYDNMNEFNQNILQGYIALFLFSNLEDQTEESLKTSIMSMKYGKGNFSLNRKEMISNFDEYVENLNLIPIE